MRGREGGGEDGICLNTSHASFGKPAHKPSSRSMEQPRMDTAWLPAMHTASLAVARKVFNTASEPNTSFRSLQNAESTRCSASKPSLRK